MNNFDLWYGAEFSDVKFLSSVVLWIMLVVISTLVPSFVKSIVYSIENINTHKDISLYINRFIPYRIFRFIVHLSITWGFATLLFSSNINFLNLSDTVNGYYAPVANLLFVFVVLLGCFALQKTVRYIWNYMFCWDFMFSKILQYSLFWDYVCCFMIGILMIVIHILVGAPDVYIITAVSVYLLWRMSIIITYITRGRPQLNDCLYLFLYLCTSEVLPYTYVYIVLDSCIAK